MSVPSRSANDRCLECMQWNLREAPRGCARCAMEEAAELGYRVYTITDMSGWDDEHYADLLSHLERGWFRRGQFYVYAAHDGGRLNLPTMQLLSMDRTVKNSYSSIVLATLAAQNAAHTYPQVWIVTWRGGWQVANEL